MSPDGTQAPPGSIDVGAGVWTVVNSRALKDGVDMSLAVRFLVQVGTDVWASPLGSDSWFKWDNPGGAWINEGFTDPRPATPPNPVPEPTPVPTTTPDPWAAITPRQDLAMRLAAAMIAAYGPRVATDLDTEVVSTLAVDLADKIFAKTA